MTEKRLNIRITTDDHDKLQELRKVLGLRSDSATVRALIEQVHAGYKLAIRQLRRTDQLRQKAAERAGLTPKRRTSRKDRR